MLYLALFTLTLVTSQFLEMEVSQAVEEYLSQLNLAPTQYAIVVSDQAPEGAALEYWIEASGKDTAVFLFDREFLLQLSRRERRVLIAHEVGHLAPECQPLGRRIYREICADVISLRLVPAVDVAAMLAKSIVMFPSYRAQKEFNYRFTVIQEYLVAIGELEGKTTRLRRFPLEYVGRLDCE